MPDVLVHPRDADVMRWQQWWRDYEVSSRRTTRQMRVVFALAAVLVVFLARFF
jgi:hypothetical protein